MKAGAKKILLIGGLLVAGLATAYFLSKKKPKPRPVGIIDDEEVDFDFENASGSAGYSSGVKEGVTLSVNDYKKSIAQTINDKKYEKYLGRKIYTLVDNVKVRMGAGVNNGIINNIAGTIPKKKSFIGKVVTAKLGEDKKIWFAVNEENSNQLFDIKKNFSWDINKPIDPSLRWLRSDTVVVNMNKKK
jgi:hypothetical protein